MSSKLQIFCIIVADGTSTHQIEIYELVVGANQGVAELGVVADEDARVEAAGVEVLARVVEEGVGEASEADALVHVAQFVGLGAGELVCGFRH